MAESNPYSSAFRHEALSSESDPIQGLIQQVIACRSKIDEQLTELQKLADLLRREIRRNPAIPAGYLVFVNANFRLAGALSNGLHRASAMDRVLTLAKEEDRIRHREAEEESGRRAAWEQKQRLQKLQSPTARDFDDLFGEVLGAEDMSHAD